ncbi:HD domain-containing protein [Reinekea blandensis]|uniref:Possible metal dependent phosphohydrolase n=1 Tax=Reinekea blandensis MED297 TaxID=314283 RepID=A4BKM6_9GAMM|nr:HD domain-containing protein [Reinekea blandensis]EAR07337.1 possible metal dependent phosphohydrolase [Reinekea sp. MED297] [Reinekea blandensis MED297]
MTPDFSILYELDRLKSIKRRSYVTTDARNENSAEHSWHLAMALWSVERQLPEDLDRMKLFKMALCHDVCEIVAGDVCAYDRAPEQTEKERAYLESLRQRSPVLGDEILQLWQEYEQGETPESQWVRVFDKLLPFMLNIASQGQTWREQGITQSRVVQHNAFIKDIAPDVHRWISKQITQAVTNGWLEAD